MLSGFERYHEGSGSQHALQAGWVVLGHGHRPGLFLGVCRELERHQPQRGTEYSRDLHGSDRRTVLFTVEKPEDLDASRGQGLVGICADDVLGIDQHPGHRRARHLVGGDPRQKLVEPPVGRLLRFSFRRHPQRIRVVGVHVG